VCFGLKDTIDHVVLTEDTRHLPEELVCLPRKKSPIISHLKKGQLLQFKHPRQIMFQQMRKRLGMLLHGTKRRLVPAKRTLMLVFLQWRDLLELS
jgi:hypothetical protein